MHIVFSSISAALFRMSLLLLLLLLLFMILFDFFFRGIFCLLLKKMISIDCKTAIYFQFQLMAWYG
jgi:hypothetical protein